MKLDKVIKTDFDVFHYIDRLKSNGYALEICNTILLWQF